MLRHGLAVRGEIATVDQAAVLALLEAVQSLDGDALAGMRAVFAAELACGNGIDAIEAFLGT